MTLKIMFPPKNYNMHFRIRQAIFSQNTAITPILEPVSQCAMGPQFWSQTKEIPIFLSL